MHAHVRRQYSSTLTSLCSRSHRTSQYSTSSFDSPFSHAAVGTYCRSGGCRPLPPPPLAGMHLLSLPSQLIRFSLPLVASRGRLRPCCYTAAATGPADSGRHRPLTVDAASPSPPPSNPYRCSLSMLHLTCAPQQTLAVTQAHRCRRDGRRSRFHASCCSSTTSSTTSRSPTSTSPPPLLQPGMAVASCTAVRVGSGLSLHC
jgi:hypothetical protein